MISRLVLVGTITALGLSIPNWSEVERGFGSFRSWTIAQLAEWDTWRPSQDDPITVPEVPAPARPETGSVGASPSDQRPGVTGSSLVVRPPSRAAIAFVPITPEDELAGVADELNRVSEGPGSRQMTPVNAEPRTRDGSIESHDPVTTDDLASTASDVSVELKLGLGLCRFAEAWQAEQTLTTATALDPEPFMACDPLDDLFDGEPAGYEPAEVSLASDVRQQPTARTAETVDEWIEPSDEVPDGTDPARRPSFEPIIVAEDLDSGIADELNRAAEGLGTGPREAARATRSEDPSVLNGEAGDGNLRRAVRMTRDAARAWMDVLAGPRSDQMAAR